ncbi:Sec1-binding region of Mso1-domain-containing protein [Coniella lustricola]|uniref:Sec1-binding region of Mso1-domain-containing protein n=1 Tax=Coniella lustricola TaxID=2025994 RepID=A0A2T2ZX99_9PEZI|nr:Sec1-binding region of Mso1-domain-containing protein [Coniella lustricola]
MSWYSNIASRVNNSVSSLQRTVFNSEADGDTEDDTYVCRVLRQYYTEKATGFPGWLPPDPKAAAPPPPPVAVNPAVAARYGNVPASQSAGGGLSSLWDKNRAAGGAAGAAPSGVNARNPFAQRNAPAAAAAPDAGLQARPALSNQKSGSYQTTASAGSSIQDRLRGRLGGGARTTSPSSAGSPFTPPPAMQGGNSGGGGGDYDPYRSGDYSTGGAPAAAPARAGGGLPSGPRRMGGLPSGPRMR